MLKRIIYIFLLLISLTTYGQRTSSSPYSFFGIGQQYNSQTVEQASMGGIGAAYSNFYHLNFINPASLADLKFATYTIGLNSSSLTVKDFSGKQSTTSIGISYANIGFPISKNAGLAFGLRPNTAVGYSLINIINDTNGDPQEVTRFYGSGGTSKIYASFGIKLFNAVNLGFEADYVFGKTENNILNQKANVRLATKNNESVTVRGGGLKIGAIYKKVFNNKLQLSLGSSVKLENNLTTKGNEYLYSLAIGSNAQETPKDTLYNSSVNGKLINPLKTVLGVGLGKADKWYAGIDYEFQKALDFQRTLISSNQTFIFGESNRISIGGHYIPRVNSITSYWERITYRVGLRFENTGLLVKASNSAEFNKIKDFGISFGLGLPLKDLSNLNLGVEYGKKGSTINNLIQENYFNFRLSLSLNDRWFQKRKIN